MLYNTVPNNKFIPIIIEGAFCCWSILKQTPKPDYLISLTLFIIVVLHVNPHKPTEAYLPNGIDQNREQCHILKQYLPFQFHPHPHTSQAAVFINQNLFKTYFEASHSEWAVRIFTLPYCRHIGEVRVRWRC